MKYVGMVDMAMKIWSGFLSYNLARTYGMIGDVENAVNAFKRSISIRASWIKLSSFNYRIRNALSSEYFIAKMSYLKMCEEFSLMKKSELRREYDIIEIEIATYSDVKEGTDPLIKIRMELSKQISIMNEWED
ncbi:MAG: hypothetical protein K6G26_06220 [Lachnospiraceae bacterium]|nr:hypothetical protein [Lachnospiraceae bacterium]